jgi:Flp pilus assembly protein TadD
MRFRKTLTFLILALAFALTAGAQQKPVAPTLRSAFCSGGVPTAGARWVNAAKVANASAYAAMLPALPAGAQQNQKPFTHEQVVSMVRDGFGDESGAKLIEQRGIDFTPSEDFIQTLKAAGASEAFLKALRAAKPPEPASVKKPLNQVQVFALLVGEVPSHRVTMLVQERGIDFDPTDDYLQEVRLAGGEDELIGALQSAKVTKPATVDPAAQARSAKVRERVAHGAELWRKRQYVQAEQEYRAALLFDPDNSDLYASLAGILGNERRWDDAAAAAREALRLNPNSDVAHGTLGFVLDKKGEIDGAIAEFRAALRSNPNDDWAHSSLGRALDEKGDLDGAIAEFRATLRLSPNDDGVHNNLGITLGKKGDLNGEIAEYRASVRLNPNIAEAHNNLGFALGEKGDLEGAISECREALRLNPNLAEAHNSLGFVLEKKGDRRAALEEYRAAYTLDPQNATNKQDYERLLQQVN